MAITCWEMNVFACVTDLAGLDVSSTTLTFTRCPLIPPWLLTQFSQSCKVLGTSFEVGRPGPDSEAMAPMTSGAPVAWPVDPVEPADPDEPVEPDEPVDPAEPVAA